VIKPSWYFDPTFFDVSDTFNSRLLSYIDLLLHQVLLLSLHPTEFYFGTELFCNAWESVLNNKINSFNSLFKHVIYSITPPPLHTYFDYIWLVW
jgi:hypothetical protein